MDNLVLIMLGAILFVGLLLLVIIATTRKGGGSLNQDEYRSKWLEIEGTFGKDETANQLAIIKADKLLDAALKQLGVPGETMGERMKSARSRFKNNDATWSAHKLRNRIAHEEVRVSVQQTRQALKAFKNALKDVGAL